MNKMTRNVYWSKKIISGKVLSDLSWVKKLSHIDKDVWENHEIYDQN